MNFLKRLHIFEISLIVIVLGLHLYAALSDAYNMPNTWFTRDDAYYYFKVAQNITEGKGSTFDGINPTNGYHPLWMAVCIPIFFLARYDLILPLRILIMVMACFNVATAIMIYRYIKENLSDTVAMMASLFWLFNAYIHYTVYEYGLESPIAAFFIVLLVYKLSQFEKQRRQRSITWREIGVLAGIATFLMFSRLDLIFLTIIAGLWIVFRGRAIRYLVLFDMVIIFISMVVSVASRTDIPTYNSQYANSTIQLTAIAMAAKIISLFFFGAYQHPRTQSIFKIVQNIILAIAIGSVGTIGLYFLFTTLGFMGSLPRSALILDFLVSTILILILRLTVYWFGNPQTVDKLTPVQTLHIDGKKWLTEGAIYYGIVGGTLSIYLLFNKILFGTSSPVSGQIKRWWGTLGPTVYDHPPTNWPSFLGMQFQGAYDTWQPTSNFFDWLARHARPFLPGSNMQDERYYIIMALSAIIVLLIFSFNAHKVKNKITNMALLPLMAGCAFQMLSYTTTAYGGAKEWYWVGQMIMIVLVESLLLQLLLNPLHKFKYMRIVLQAAVITTGIILASRQADYFNSVMRYNYFPADRPYMEVLPFLEENTPPGAVIGMTGGGNVGYFIQDRTIVNMDGLINSYDYFQALQAGTASDYLRKHEVEYVFASASLLDFPPYYGQFSSRLETYNAYGGKSLMYLLDKPKY